MPNIKEGSIIDIKYTLNSKNIFNIKSWYFQNTIPVKYSMVDFEYPDFLIYRINTLGTYQKYKSKEDIQNGRFNKKVVTVNHSRIEVRNVRSVESELYFTNKRALLSCVDYTLTNIIPKYGFRHSINKSYKKFKKECYKILQFKAQDNKYYTNWAPLLKNKSEREKVEIIYNKFRNEISFNGDNSIIRKNKGNIIFSEKEGSLGTIVNGFIYALNVHGIKANPVILKTRSQGIMHPLYPDQKTPYYIVAGVMIDDELVLIDPTYSGPMGYLKEECINGQGWLVDKKGRWVDLTSNAVKKISTFTSAKIEGDKIKMKINIKSTDYEAALNYNKSEDDLKKQISKGYDNIEIDSINILDENNQEILKYEAFASEYSDNQDAIIVKPYFYKSIVKNPFIKEKRISNIDFIYRLNNNSVFSLEIPEGYRVDLPKSINIRSEDGSIKFKYAANKIGNKVNVTQKIVFNKSVFSPSDYFVIKSMFEQVAQANNQEVILIKE